MQQDTERTLTILHTNDLHSHFDAMTRISARIELERLASGGRLLLLDIGDHMDRAEVLTEGTLGQANVDILNLNAYDAVTIGNNEGLTFTAEMLETAYAGLTCPVVCCNVRDRNTGRPPVWMKEHVVIEKAGFTLGLIGATAPFAEFYELMGWEALNPFESIAVEVNKIRGKVDLVIVMSHLGLNSDKKLAESIPGIDLILGGHSHHLLEQPLMMKGTALAAAEKFGHYLGKIKITRAEDGRAFVRSGEAIKIPENAEVDPDIAAAISIHTEHALERLSRAVAVTDRELPVSYEEESPFGNLLAQSVRRFTGAQISLVNTGQLLNGLPQGEVTEGMLHALCPSPINPVRMKLAGKHILQALEEALLPEMTGKPIFGFGFRGRTLGTLCVDGLEIVYDPERAPFHRILEASIEGIPMQPEQLYDVGTLDMFTFGIGYTTLALGEEKTFMLPEFLRDLLKGELQTPGALESSFMPRWNKDKLAFGGKTESH